MDILCLSSLPIIFVTLTAITLNVLRSAWYRCTFLLDDILGGLMYQGYAPATSQVEHECHLSNKTPSTVHLCDLAKAKTLSQKSLRSAVVH